ncbi:hypothetical protein [Faecalitalea cylindroides]|uniref:hypothetical protein n=1 Tax=Faecalitalea cylindroides TaxID=39483 RepID=UPI000B390D0F|nr:hypothetical protein [Faecalitalea cylindroides]MBM6811300.1 hypothetical protein [Faecalitalea cylindroides]OUN58509.1 hypothetical protein B5G15_09025 [Faecalitalea cylindroides]
MVTLTKTEYEALEQARNVIDIVLTKSKLNERKKAKKKQKPLNASNEPFNGCGELLAKYGVLNEQELLIEKKLLSEFEYYYEAMQPKDFEQVLQRVQEYTKTGKVKNIKIYALKAVEQEYKKGA